MKLKIQNRYYGEFIRKINFTIFKKIFFLIGLLYFCFYSFNNNSQITFDIDLEKNVAYIFLSFLFCILSIYFNAFAWKNIVIWFGKDSKKDNLVSFYVLTNILKYVPGGIWHFVERFNYIKNISNPQLAFYSTLIEPYFMICASFLLASIGIIFSPFYLFLIIPLVFLNRKLIYLVLRRLESLKSKAAGALKLPISKYQFEQKINLEYFFPSKAFLYEIGFVLLKFIGFFVCYCFIFSNYYNFEFPFSTLYSIENLEIIFLFVIFCLSWTIGLIVPGAPSGIGIFETCFIVFAGKNIPQPVIAESLIFFRIISTLADLLISFPFIIKKIFKKT